MLLHLNHAKHYYVLQVTTRECSSAQMLDVQTILYTVILLLVLLSTFIYYFIEKKKNINETVKLFDNIRYAISGFFIFIFVQDHNVDTHTTTLVRI